MQNKNILIVEDDELTLKFLSKYLSRYFNVTLAQTPDIFYEVIKTNKFDLILMDISLRNKIDGLQLTKELRNLDEYKNCPIVVLTANVLKRDEKAAFEAGVTKFLRKPIDNQVLLDELLDSAK